MKRTVIGVVVLAALALAGYGVYQGWGYYRFKSLQGQCYQKLNNATGTITFYFTPQSSSSSIQMIADAVNAQYGAGSASFVSADQALRLFDQKHAGDPTLQKALQELTTNPLRSSLEVVIGPNGDASGTIDYVNAEAEKYGVTIAGPPSESLPGGPMGKQVALNAIMHLPDTEQSIQILQGCVNGTGTGLGSFVL